jgi:hypothetical protein
LPDQADRRQALDDAAELEFVLRDLRDSANPQAEIERHLAEDRRRGFDLRTAPLSRAALFRTAARQYEFVWTFHHILLDGGRHGHKYRRDFWLRLLAGREEYDGG